VRILVSFKVTPDYEALREADWVAGAACDVETHFVRRILNCFDESALELALRLSETLGDGGIAPDLGAVTVAGREAEPFLRTLQALGYRRAARVQTDADLDFAPAATASVIAGYARRVHGSDLLLLGCRSGPGDGGTVPFLVAEHLRWPCLSQVVAIEPLTDDRLRVTSVADDGLLRLTLRLPCVLAVGNAVVSHLRVPTLTQRLAARGVDLEVLSPDDVGVDLDHELGREGRMLTAVETVDRARRGVVIPGETPQDKARTLFDVHLKSRIETP
jgi:electron transfer flavoprotein beta subunit